MALVSKSGCISGHLGVGCRRLEKRREALWGHNFLRDIQVTGAPRAYHGASGESSDARFVGFRPKLIGLDERVENREQLSHGRGQGHFLEFPLSQQALIKVFDSGVESRGHERGHVEYATDIGSAAERAALAG